MDEKAHTEEIRLIAEGDGDKRIDAWLSGKLENYSRSYIQKLIEDKLVNVNGCIVKPSYKVKHGDEIVVKLPEPAKIKVTAEKINLDIVFEDDYIIVVNKPKGMVVHPGAGNYTGTLVNALMEYCGDRLSDINGVIRPGIVHRLDKDTSGLLVVAKNNFAHEKLSMELKKHNIKRIYAAIVSGVLKEDWGKIDAPIGRHSTERKKMAVNTRNGRRAVTRFRVLERLRDATYVELELETGRTHQIRVHMSFIGHPVMGDEVYGRSKPKHPSAGQVLHARLLGLKHPMTGEYMEFEAQLPEYFENLLKLMRW